jgi:hypothetical protein
MGRKIEFEITPRFDSLDCLHNTLNMRTKAWPLLQPQNNYGNLAARKILLITHILVGRQQHVEASRFRDRQQFAILKGRPTLLRCGPHLVLR